MGKARTTRKKARAFVGTSGFMYSHWGNGVFYPKKLPQREWLEFYVEHFNTVELNVVFYRLPSEDAFRSWYRRTPKDFRFALKGSRFITHIKRLKGCSEPLKLYFKRARLLKEKLSVVLWQMPPRFKKDAPRLWDFVRALKDYGSTRHAFEFRDATWFDGDVYEMLHKADMALCMADWPRYGVKIPETASIIYLRRHGPEGGRLYTGCYPKADLRRDAREIKRWLSAGKDVYIYFNNDERGWAVKNALDVKKSIERSRIG
ncbi:MAG: DUF72 domain-containing protein [Candidatus Brocadiales bacterium]